MLSLSQLNLYFGRNRRFLKIAAKVIIFRTFFLKIRRMTNSLGSVEIDVLSEKYKEMVTFVDDQELRNQIFAKLKTNSNLVQQGLLSRNGKVDQKLVCVLVECCMSFGKVVELIYSKKDIESGAVQSLHKALINCHLMPAVLFRINPEDGADNG